MKLYRAVDKMDGADSMFLVYDNEEVAVAGWAFSDSEEVQLVKQCTGDYLRSSARRFKDAIDPVLIMEW